ncbi:MAG: hypothetical protein KBD00_03760 [Candidatus Peribacteraceae bacterium]|nr:hypothetical protein [Candidatus Peribacteraceae bacterium]
MLTPREIIAEAWKITLIERSLRRWGFFGSFFEILLDVKLLIYQIYFIYEEVYHHGEAGLFDIEIWLYNALPFWLFMTIIIAFLVLLFVEFLIPSFIEGAIIGLAAKSYRKEPVNGGFILGMYNFFPLFALHEIFSFSSLTMLITIQSILWRYGGNMGPPLMVIAMIFWLLSNFFKFFFNFASEAVVIQKLSIYHASGKSVKLIVSNLKHLMFLIILMVVISVRIIINALVILLLPGIIIGIGLFLAMFLNPAISYVIAGVLGIILILIASYFFAYLHVFKQTVWTLTFIELSKQKDLDKIE